MWLKLKHLLLIAVALALLVAAAMAGWRQLDRRADQALWQRLASTQPSSPERFDPAMLKGLPDPVQRFFRFTIDTGTPLYTVSEISMQGRFSLGSKAAPNYFSMTAQEILAAPLGFVWTMAASRGLVSISGSDTGSWSRFWLNGLVPVARMGGSPDHALSSFGRYMAEALFWSPAALLPGPHVTWEAIDDHSARVLVSHGGLEQTIELTIEENGRPTAVQFLRWSDANPEGVFRFQPFGGYLSEFRDFHGFHLPTHVEAGNQFGTDEYFPFYIVDVTQVRFPGTQARD